MNNNISEMRSFLHDVSTPICIIRLTAKQLLKLSSARQPDPQEQKAFQQLMDAISKLEALHADQKFKTFKEEAS